MKPSRLTILALVLAAAPLAVWATEADDRIEAATMETDNFRTVLHDQVKVEVDEGVMELTGTVSDESLKALAEETARNIPGVVEVDNQIDVEVPPPEHSDAWIALKARTSLLMHSEVSVNKTDVAVSAGVVTLSGMVDSVAQKELTVAYIKEIDGVKDIIDRMTVKEIPVETRTLGAVIDDASITARVKYELLSHRSTSALTTNVTTKKGSVVVEGEADSMAERTLVTKLARRVRGVIAVDNQMTLKPSE